MLTFARAFVVVLGVMLVAVGIWIAAVENEGSIGLVLVGLMTAFIGVACIVSIGLERIRYRSAAAEVPATVGPPGGEPGGTALDSRFQPTNEVFVDPTSGTRMRVFLDRDTGERRYQPEG